MSLLVMLMSPIVMLMSQLIVVLARIIPQELRGVKRTGTPDKVAHWEFSTTLWKTIFPQVITSFPQG